MDAQEIRQGIALLPPTAQTKPLLDAMLTRLDAMLTRLEILEDSQSNPHAPTLAAMRQEIDAAKLHQGHPPGLCYEATCDSCMAQGQDLVSQGRSIGREAVQADIDQALEWGYGDAIQGKIALAVQKWLAAGRPPPGSAPALTSASTPESERNILFE